MKIQIGRCEAWCFLIFVLSMIVIWIILNAVPWSVIDEPIEPEQEHVPPAVGGMESAVKEPIQEEPPDHRLQFPVAEEDWWLSSPYGVRVSPFSGILRHHEGVDITAVEQAQVVAVADGQVVEWWPPPDGHFKGHPKMGGMIRIKHADGIESVYGHLGNTYIRGWERVKAGQVIGRIGSTGISTGPHLHFELRIDGELVNPLLYLDGGAL